jgi:hypothetical protein
LREDLADQLIKVLANLVQEVSILREELATNRSEDIGQLMGSRRKASLSDVVDAIASVGDALTNRKAQSSH